MAQSLSVLFKSQSTLRGNVPPKGTWAGQVLVPKCCFKAVGSCSLRNNRAVPSHGDLKGKEAGTLASVTASWPGRQSTKQQGHRSPGQGPHSREPGPSAHSVQSGPERCDWQPATGMNGQRAEEHFARVELPEDMLPLAGNPRNTPANIHTPFPLRQVNKQTFLQALS